MGREKVMHQTTHTHSKGAQKNIKGLNINYINEDST